MKFETIEKQRCSLGLSQRDLCAAAGIHYMTYTAIKRGRQVPNMRTIEKLEAGLMQLQERQEAHECTA